MSTAALLPQLSASTNVAASGGGDLFGDAGASGVSAGAPGATSAFDQALLGLLGGSPADTTTSANTLSTPVAAASPIAQQAETAAVPSAAGKASGRSAIVFEPVTVASILLAAAPAASSPTGLSTAKQSSPSVGTEAKTAKDSKGSLEPDATATVAPTTPPPAVVAAIAVPLAVAATPQTTTATPPDSATAGTSIAVPTAAALPAANPPAATTGTPAASANATPTPALAFAKPADPAPSAPATFIATPDAVSISPKPASPSTPVAPQVTVASATGSIAKPPPAAVADRPEATSSAIPADTLSQQTVAANTSAKATPAPSAPNTDAPSTAAQPAAAPTGAILSSLGLNTPAAAPQTTAVIIPALATQSAILQAPQAAAQDQSANPVAAAMSGAKPTASPTGTASAAAQIPISTGALVSLAAQASSPAPVRSTTTSAPPPARTLSADQPQTAMPTAPVSNIADAGADFALPANLSTMLQAQTSATNPAATSPAPQKLAASTAPKLAQSADSDTPAPVQATPLAPAVAAAAAKTAPSIATTDGRVADNLNTQPKLAQPSNAAATIAIPFAAANTASEAQANTASGQGAAIVSQVADQIVRKVDGKSTSFDIALNPVGLGQVNVKVAIDAAGQVTAQLSFANPHAAAEAQSRAGDLQQALQQAGFNLAQGGLSFGSNGTGAGFAGQDGQFQGGGSSAPTLQASTDAADAPSAPAAALATGSGSAASGVDIKI